MKPSSERLQARVVSNHNEPCNERKCANCFENRGCMYDRYMSASVEELEWPQITQALSQEKGTPSSLHGNAAM